jgi:hypothetical protein
MAKKKPEVEEVKKPKTPQEMWADYIFQKKTVPPWSCDNKKVPVYNYLAIVRLVEQDLARDDNVFEVGEPLSVQVQVYDKPGEKKWYPVEGVDIEIYRPDMARIEKKTGPDGKVLFTPYMKGKWTFIQRDLDAIATFHVGEE